MHVNSGKREEMKSSHGLEEASASQNQSGGCCSEWSGIPTEARKAIMDTLARRF